MWYSIIMLTQLKHIGLSENEAKAYLAMLELGPSTMLEISARASINRPTAYAQLESLKKKGLVSTQTKGKKQFFIAEDPDQLEILVNQEKKLLSQKQDELGKIMPELKTLFTASGERPQVRYFEGKDGLLKMQEEFLKTKEKIITGIYAVDEVLAVFPEHHETYTPRRLAKKIKTKGIYTSKRGPFLEKEDNEKLLREFKYVPPEKLPISIDITIFDNNVAISTLKGKIGGTIITHPEVAHSFKGIFDFLWKATF